MPGYGFSGKPTTSGWDPARIGRAWAVLMKRLGYTRYVAQGGDWGAIVNELFATQGHPGFIGIHSSMPSVIHPKSTKLPWPAARRHRVSQPEGARTRRWPLHTARPTTVALGKDWELYGPHMR